MSEIMLTLRDAHRAIFHTVHISTADSFVAALADEPESLEELESATARFFDFGDLVSPCRHFFPGENETPWDLGTMVVDLSARTIAWEAEGYQPVANGVVQYQTNSMDAEEAAIWLPYQIPEDWLLTGSLECGRVQAEKRRRHRASMPPIEMRSILYEQVIEFMVRECRTAKADKTEDPIAAIHAKWLMTPREDLRGQTPREILLQSMDRIDLSCESRAQQWTYTQIRPAGLSRLTQAYCFGLFGRHENVLYYELLRDLLNSYWHDLNDGRTASLEEDLENLRQHKDKWLAAPSEEYLGLSPAALINLERQRLPIACGNEMAKSHPDCPLCQDMAELPGPMFWHLDGCNMDDDFPFSFNRTREEWERQMAEREAFDREFSQHGLESKAPPNQHIM